MLPSDRLANLAQLQQPALGTTGPVEPQMGLLEKLAIGSSFIPGAGDVLGLLSDAKMYRDQPESRTWGNAALTATGLIPGIPPAMAMFAGIGAKTANKEALMEAMKMAKKKADPEAIRQKTGWFQGPDQKWRFEIPDNEARFMPQGETAVMPGRLELAQQYFEQQGIPRVKAFTGQFPEVDKAGLAWADTQLAAAREGAATQPISQVLKHDALYEAYPDLANTPAARETLSSVGGSFNNGRITYGGGLAMERSTMLHELQHAIQEREGFARGGSPTEIASLRNTVNDLNRQMDALHQQTGFSAALKDAMRSGRIKSQADVERFQDEFYARQPEGVWAQFAGLQTKQRDAFPPDNPSLANAFFGSETDAYKRLAGEVEARDVQARADLSPLERLSQAPYSSQGIAPEDMILRFRNR